MTSRDGDARARTLDPVTAPPSELDRILAALETVGTGPVALATVVTVWGSAYRRPGARLVVPTDGEPVGTIAGGCLEAEVVELARGVAAADRPRLLRVDLAADDPDWGWGLGCAGAVEVLVEPDGPARRFAVWLAAARRDERRLAVVSLVAGGPLGARLAVDADGWVQGGLGHPDLDQAARALGRLALDTGDAAGARELGADARALVEVLEPPLRLVVCGGGPDAAPLVEFAARLGWRVDVVDDRAGLLTRERFPAASRLVTAEPEAAADAAGTDSRSHVVVMSHHLGRDRAYLRSFLDRPPAYLGVLGPRSRLERLLDDLRTTPPAPPADVLARLHGPAGLDLGAEGPDEIAWSIVAEILAVRRHAPAGFLRDRPGPVRAATASALSGR